MRDYDELVKIINDLKEFGDYCTRWGNDLRGNLLKIAADTIAELAKPIGPKWVRRLTNDDPAFRLAYYFCDQCGTPQYNATRFCSYCGARMTGVIEQEEASND